LTDNTLIPVARSSTSRPHQHCRNVTALGPRSLPRVAAPELSEVEVSDQLLAVSWRPGQGRQEGLDDVAKVTGAVSAARVVTPLQGQDQLSDAGRPSIADSVANGSVEGEAAHHVVHVVRSQEF